MINYRLKVTSYLYKGLQTYLTYITISYVQAPCSTDVQTFKPLVLSN